MQCFLLIDFHDDNRHQERMPTPIDVCNAHIPTIHADFTTPFPPYAIIDTIIDQFQL